MAKTCDMCGGKLGFILSFVLKDGTICNKCYDKLYYVVDTLKLDKEVRDFTVENAKELIKNFDIARTQSEGMKRIVDSEKPDENGEVHCAYCRKTMKKGILGSSGIKQGRICPDCTNRLMTAWRFVQNAPQECKLYTVKDMDLLFSEYEKYKGNLSEGKKSAIENEEKAIAKGGIGQFFKEVGDAGLVRKADEAIAEAYRVEQEKRKPHIKRIEHQRPLTMEEQQTIDLLEMEAMKFGSNQFDRMNRGGMQSHEKTGAFVNTLFTGMEYDKKIDEIKSRAIWYEDVQVPPEVDPSVPIFVDEDAIRRKIYGNRYIVIMEKNK